MIFAQPSRPGLLLALLLGAVACTAPPRPTAGMRAVAANARAAVEGEVLDKEGRGIAGIEVTALPRGRDIPWSPPAKTDSAGRFRLTLLAPAEYGFFLRWKGRTVMTADPEDPSRLSVSVQPGETRSGIRLVFLQAEWEKIP